MPSDVKKTFIEKYSLPITYGIFLLASIPYFTYGQLVEAEVHKRASKTTFTILLIITGIATAISMLLIGYSDYKYAKHITIGLTLCIFIFHLVLAGITDKTQGYGHTLLGLVGGVLTTLAICGYASLQAANYTITEKKN